MSPLDAPLPVEGAAPEVEELPLHDELPSVDIAGKRGEYFFTQSHEVT